jgi:hypothetical protein
MKHKQNRSKVNHYTVSGLVVLVIILATAGVFVLGRSHTEAATSPVKKSVPTVISQFAFNGAKGWTQGPKNNTSMAAFYTPSDCFVSIQRNTGTIDVDTELQKTIALLAGNGYTVTQSAVQPMMLASKSGNIQYQLHQYAVSGNGSGGQSYAAQEYAFIPLSNGYLKVEGYCTISTNLPATVNALDAYEFDTSKATVIK